jgi:protocatechuate 3,4-dioxygenase, beta subunit
MSRVKSTDKTETLPVPYRRDAQGSQPNSLYEPYRSTIKRSPSRPLIFLPHTLSEVTRQHGGEPLGERIIVTGRVLDSSGRAVPRALIEIWQANAAGRYVHGRDQHSAPLDPNFTGAGRTMTDENGVYRFVTIKPGAYPWLNHYNAWRPAHIHLSIFGTAFITRLVTQMYFPGDPLFAFDPVYQSIPDERARERLVSKFDLETTQPRWALGYRFDVVLRGPDATPFEASL